MKPTSTRGVGDEQCRLGFWGCRRFCLDLLPLPDDPDVVLDGAEAGRASTVLVRDILQGRLVIC